GGRARIALRRGPPSPRWRRSRSSATRGPSAALHAGLRLVPTDGAKTPGRARSPKRDDWPPPPGARTRRRQQAAGRVAPSVAQDSEIGTGAGLLRTGSVEGLAGPHG